MGKVILDDPLQDVSPEISPTPFGARVTVASAVPCTNCGRAMRVCYCEPVEPHRQLSIYECSRCRTTRSVLALVSAR